MGIHFGYEKMRMMEEEYIKSIRKVKVDKKSADKIIKIIREKSDGIMDNNLTYSLGGSRVNSLIRRIELHIEKV